MKKEYLRKCLTDLEEKVYDLRLRNNRQPVNDSGIDENYDSGIVSERLTQVSAILSNIIKIS